MHVHKFRADRNTIQEPFPSVQSHIGGLDSKLRGVRSIANQLPRHLLAWLCTIIQSTVDGASWGACKRARVGQQVQKIIHGIGATTLTDTAGELAYIFYNQCKGFETETVCIL